MTGGERGYVLFRCDREPGPAPTGPLAERLIACRHRLHRLGLIGVHADGIGFGNVSVRVPASGSFTITGTNTGRFPSLSPDGLTLVTAFDFAANSLSCRGPIDASSESLSHAAVYRADPDAGAVIHVHDRDAWRKLVHRLPTTDPAALAGTPRMALAIEALVRSGAAREAGVFVMGGHPDGLMGFGADPDHAAERILAAVGHVNADVRRSDR